MASTLGEIIKKYIQDKGMEYREAGNGQYVFKLCPSCGDDKFHHFYMNAEEGLYDCKKCGVKGNFNQFRELNGDSMIQLEDYSVTLFTPKKPKEYKTLNYDLALQQAARLWGTDIDYVDYLLKTRKLSEEIVREFKIGSKGDGISIPIYENGKLVNIRYRRDPMKDGAPEAAPRYSQEKGCKAALFNGDVLTEDVKTVYVTEGEFDAMQLIQRGFRNTVSITLGAGYFPDHWIEKFENATEIYFVYDTDEDGIKGAKKASEKLGSKRCKIVMLPTKAGRKKTDVSTYFVDDEKTKDDFLALVKKAKSALALDNQLIKQLYEFNDPLRELLLKGDHVGEPTGFEQLDNLFGGLRKGRLIVISGLTNTGKSSFASNICLKLGARNFPSFYLSLEMPPIDIAKKLLMLRSKLGGDDIKSIEDPSDVLTKIDETLLEFRGDEEKAPFPIYLYNGSGMVEYKILADAARLAKEEYGCQCIFVDHLHYFAMSGNNVTAETSRIVRQIKQLAMELDLTIILLAHLNRGGRTKSRTGMYIPSLADLKETSTIEQDADQVLFVCRDSETEDDDERKKAFIKVAKNRDGKAGPSISMNFHEDTAIFDELKDPGVSYEQEAKETTESLKAELADDTSLIF